jgi:hypothetical protein
MKRITLALGSLLTCGGVSVGLLSAPEPSGQAGAAAQASRTTSHGLQAAPVGAQMAEIPARPVIGHREAFLPDGCPCLKPREQSR